MDAAVNLQAAAAAVDEADALTGWVGFADTGGLFDLTELADDGLWRSLVAVTNAGRSVADANEADDLSVCVTVPSLLFLISSTDWSALTNVACLMGAVGRSFLLLAVIDWFEDDGRDCDAVDLELAADSVRVCETSERRFTLLSTALVCVVVGGFFSAADC